MEYHEPSLPGENLRQRRLQHNLRNCCHQKTNNAPPRPLPQTDDIYCVQNREVDGRYLPGYRHLGKREPMSLVTVQVVQTEIMLRLVIADPVEEGETGRVHPATPLHGRP